ncbi:PadR family transcriptional regulator [Protaetiibacter intestinalis]|uniref:PadR family transcriptional regulator n=1 Tax=Protaetiibacter intestinalis TaxID=2419774 RepID=A0A387B6Z9_9MICO|nr:PadR family transcriptional regulator [Protaetiibacter intestinalis]AYF96846.1 PadR family transcriptional regulator [Protaetiibacter intestinalis]
MIATDHATQLRRGVVEACILGLLARESMYGWQLAERLIADGAIIGSIGTLYPVLSRLRERGLVTSYEVASESGPPRRYYELTTAGAAALHRFRDDWTSFAASVTQIIAPEETP